MKKSIIRLISLLALASVFAGCSTPDYATRDSISDQAGDNIVRYGTTAVAGAGIGYGVYKYTKSPLLGAAAGGLASLATLQIFKYSDRKAERAYQAGIAVGGETSRSEILKEKWYREAVLGMPGEGSSLNQTMGTRRVWEPERDINGVKYAAGYETVQYAH